MLVEDHVELRELVRVVVEAFLYQVPESSRGDGAVGWLWGDRFATGW